MVENAKIIKLKCDILGDFQTLCVTGYSWGFANSNKDVALKKAK